MKKIIIATHGFFASGIKDALKLLVDENIDVITINGFTVDENPKGLIDDLMESFGADDEIIAFTDIFGGSINQFFIPWLEKRNLLLITGINLALCLELLVDIDSIDIDKVRAAVETAKTTIMLVNDEMKEAKDDDSSFFE